MPKREGRSGGNEFEGLKAATRNGFVINMAQMTQHSVPIAQGLFEWLDDGAHLIGSKCLECGEVTFPTSAFCPQCCRQTTERILLSQRGRLHSFTVQRFKPPPPYKGVDPFQPYGVGVIELPEGLRVTSVLEESDPDRLRVGIEMELVIGSFFSDEEGRDVVGYKFKPLGGTPEVRTSPSVHPERLGP